MTRIAGLAVLFIAPLVTIGWINDLLSVGPDYSFLYRMKVHTTVAFMSSSLALYLLAAWQPTAQVRTAGLLCAVFTLLMGIASLLRHAVGYDFGIDPLLMAEELSPLALDGMSVMSAVSFIGIGIALLGMHRRIAPGWIQYVTVGIMLSWVGIAIAHVYGVIALYQAQPFGGISIPTTLCFILLTAGMLVSRPLLGFMALFTNSGFGGIAARRLLPAALLIPFVSGWLLVWSRETDFVDVRVAAAVQAISFSVVFALLIAWTSRSISRLERLVTMKQHERMQALEKAAHLAHYDVLTNLPNRALLRERLGTAIRMATRKGGRVALLFLDLDRFKPINDTFGHEAGDQVLVEVAARLLGSVRNSDTVSRQGGDEFIILLQDIDDLEDVSRIAANILASIEQPFVIHGSQLYLAGSIGISLYPDDGDDIQLLIEHADAAMYYAKSLGRKNYQFFAPHINEQAMRRSLAERQIRTALSENLFMLHYQPKIDIASGRLIGAEALIRMRTSEGRPIPPEQFISVAEDCGLIIPIGKWVMREACHQIRVWQDAGHPWIPVSINISAAQFKDRSFVEFVKSVLAETRVAPGCLDIEVTETTAMQDFEHSIATMKALRNLGVSLSIDDFGTGYSSLSYLKRFSIDSLKIDRSFIQDLPQSSDDAAITCAIIDMAKNLKQKVIAEGVENEHQLSFLKAQGCDQVQGFYFSEPLTAEKFEMAFFDDAANDGHIRSSQNSA